MRMETKAAVAAALLAVGGLSANSAHAVAIGQVDTFEDGTTQNWVVGLLGAAHPAPPVNVATGGPAGAGDHFLRLTAVGGQGAGSRLAAINLAQWAGDYAGVGVAAISLDLINLGATDLAIRLYLENPRGAPPTDEAVTDAMTLAAGGGWTRAVFAVDPGSLTVLAGDVGVLLGDVTALRLVHAPLAEFPGPAVTGVLGVDNITAQGATAVAEPPALTLAAAGLLGLAAWTRRRRLG